MHKNTLIQCNIKIILAISRHLAPLPARRGAFGVMIWKKVLSFRRIFTIQFTHLIICIMAREQEKLSKDVLAVLDKKTNDLRLVSEMNEQTGEFNTVSTAPGDRRRALSFDSRTVLGTFFENLRNQYAKAKIRTAPWPKRSPTTNSTTRGVSPSSPTAISSRNGNFRGIRFRRWA